VLVLRDVQEFSYQEIGDILKISEGTVKSRLFRAREALKDSLKKALGGL
jgi:RNA polymerase sigma-70 factor (ECF subfamily)